ncbi:nucleotidyltransferase domain-containing protein [Cyanobacterium aponinum FACHB-4101]|uniref:nucleotidyltransferase family protein n=1 Tax=Cyanobacterium aponinum TaxID=379064 RepID=UPI00168170E6|nr:nucleotidyltransferase domain-containing protein [Cyanobacterium aponinum]MBD2392995.1 nucleotidyltransferase domain-containing protein [Cyanobacterium aponinum FACHB-4101]
MKINYHQNNNIKPIIQERLGVSWENIVSFCQQFKIKELALFGSILRDDFSVNSDVDFLITLSADTKLDWIYFQLMEKELKKMVNRKIDIIFKNNLEKSANWIRKKEILTTAEVIYESYLVSLLYN